MIISEHKRTSYDQNGHIAKMDILRCIRKKDQNPSFLQQHHSIERHQQNCQQISQKQKFLKITQNLCITIIILCILLLLLRFFGFSINFGFQSTLNIEQHSILNSQQIKEIGQKYWKQYNEKLLQLGQNNSLTLNQFKNYLQIDKNIQKQAWSYFIIKLTDNLQCKMKSKEKYDVVCQIKSLQL